MNTLIKFLLVLILSFSAVWITCGWSMLIWTAIFWFWYEILGFMMISWIIIAILGLYIFARFYELAYKDPKISWKELVKHRFVLNFIQLTIALIILYSAFIVIASLVWDISQNIHPQVFSGILAIWFLSLCYYFLIKKK
jgi:hypothetical protein